MEINSVKRADPEKDTPERRLEEILEAFDPMGKARLESLDEAIQKLSGASRVLSMVDTVKPDSEGMIKVEDSRANTIKEVIGDINLACRKLRDVALGQEQIIRNLITEMTRIVQAIAHNEGNTYECYTKLEVLRMTLHKKDVLTVEELQQTLKEDVVPQLERARQEQMAGNPNSKADSPAQ